MLARASSLTVRFYVMDGWTEEILTYCFASPTAKLKTWPNDDRPYWIPDCPNCFDLDRLVQHLTMLQTYEGPLLFEQNLIRKYLEIHL